MSIDTTSQRFFEEKYRQATDPWQFASSDYEQARYTAILNALRHQRYIRAFEPGCSIGILTAGLAPLCDRVDAIDISPTAVERAKAHCKDYSNVHISCGALLGVLPDVGLDLVVFSEIGYYFEEEQLRTLANLLIERTAAAGTFLATHWLGKSNDHLLSGDRVHEILHSLPGLTHEYAERRASFRLDRWTKK